jgi:hypothetical protein
LWSGFYGVDDELVAAVEGDHDSFKEPAVGVEAKEGCRA